MSTLQIDLETRSTVELPDVGMYIYANHPDTETLLARYCIDDGPINGWRMGNPCPDDLRRALADPEVTVCAHNAAFEWHMIEYNLSIYHFWPTVDRTRLDCTAARAAIMSLPRALAGAAKAIGLDVEKDDEGRRLMLQMCKPRKPRKDEDPDLIYWFDDEARMNRLDRYCERDVEVERELDKILVPMSKREKKYWLLDFVINLRGVAVDSLLVQEADKILRRSLRDYGKDLSEITGGAVSTVNQIKGFKEWLLPRLPEDLAEIADESLDKDHLPLVADGLREHINNIEVTDLQTLAYADETLLALEIRKQAAKSSTAKLAQFMKRTGPDGRMRENHLYHGAGTGRWSGKGVQLQNMPRPTLKQSQIDHAIRIICDTTRTVADRAEELEFLFGPIPSVISSCLRACLVPRDENHRFVVADYSNIEGRVNAWAAGQADKVEIFRNNGPVYERMGEKIYGIPAEEITKDMIERHVSKTAELGCGYQMGGKKFLRTCLDAGITNIDLEMAEQVVATYRELNYMIKKFWYGMEAAAIDAMKQPGTVTEFRDFKFACTPDKSFLVMVLPCNRRLYYPAPRLKKKKTPWGDWKDQVTYMGTDQYTRQWVRLSTYGGKLVENAVQATARDLLAAAMLRVEEQLGFPVVLTVHDEIVCDVSADDVSNWNDALKDLEVTMCELPSWAEGCPVAAEGYHYGRFKK